MEHRDRVLKALEERRASGELSNPLDAGITLALPAEQRAVVESFLQELPDLCGVSRFELVDGAEAAVEVNDLSDELRCERSWKRDGTVRERSDGGLLSDRDAAAVGLA